MKAAIISDRRLRRGLHFFCTVCLALCACAANASIALLLEQPYGGLGAVNPTGHSAIYLDHVCAATPLQLRPCRPGELGVVISRYDGIDGHDWIAIPLIPYLYAVSDSESIPASVDRIAADRLRDQYRRRYLESVAPDTADGSAPDSNWYELVGSAFDRTIYGFEVSTTPGQDARLIALLNDSANQERYNGAFRNCADFARVTINRFYPHAVRRNFIADFGLTTPKSVARGLAHYARKHPQVGLHEFVVPQVDGLSRSFGIQGVSESLLKRYGIPLLLLSPTTTAVVFAAYLQHGRFPMPHDAPRLDAPALEYAAAWAARGERESMSETASAAETLPGEAPAGLSGPVAPPDLPRPADVESTFVAVPLSSDALTPALFNGTP